jgi:hypothetical protein
MDPPVISSVTTFLDARNSFSPIRAPYRYNQWSVAIGGLDAFDWVVCDGVFVA